MLLPSQPLPPVPDDTARIARAAFRRGNPYVLLRDKLGAVFADGDFADLYPKLGQPAYAPWRLALVTLMQFREGLSDRQAADAVRGRIDWKHVHPHDAEQRLARQVPAPDLIVSGPPLGAAFGTRLLEPGEDDTSSPLWPRQSNNSSQVTGPPKIKPNRPRDSHISSSVALHGRAHKLSTDDLCTHLIDGVKRFRTHSHTYPRTRIRTWAVILFRGCAQTQTFVCKPMGKDYERVLAMVLHRLRAGCGKAAPSASA